MFALKAEIWAQKETDRKKRGASFSLAAGPKREFLWASQDRSGGSGPRTKMPSCCHRAVGRFDAFEEWTGGYTGRRIDSWPRLWPDRGRRWKIKSRLRQPEECRRVDPSKLPNNEWEAYKRGREIHQRLINEAIGWARRTVLQFFD